MTGVRFHDDLAEAIVAWAKRQPDKPSKAEAIRRLVEMALTTAGSHAPYTKKSAGEAAEMAERQIDRMSDQSATSEERQSRKRKLLKGPAEFRNMRKKPSKR